MTIDFHTSFHKQVSNLKPGQKQHLKDALLLFADDPYHPNLHNHPLTGEWKGFRSISFGGDWRIHYKAINDNTVLFVAVGTHSQLYA